MHIIDVIEGDQGNYTYRFPEAARMARQWLDKFQKSGDRYDWKVFVACVNKFFDEPVLSDVQPFFRGYEMDRDALKILNGYLDLMLQSFATRHWKELKYRFAVFQSMVWQVNYHVLGGWNPRKKDDAKTIIVQMLDDDVLGIRWAGDRRWVEVRGTNYWKWNRDDPLHQLIDRLSGNKSDLMIGREIAVSPRYDEYEELKGLLSESRAT